ncbi:MAG: serine/threonine-protein kinase, partial [Chloroflexota bacterium]
MTPVEGRQIGQYQVVGEIGRGGMATVYRAYQPNLERYVAVKVLRTEADAHFWERFRAEARVVASLRHPHIVQIYDLGEEDELLYIVMELIEGTSLRQRLRPPWAPPAAVGVVAQLASALDFAHSRGVIHRDVKPANVLLEGDRVLLADFGIARMLNAVSRMTRVDATLGTPDYMSPEQAAAGEVGPASDIYSLGVVAYELLTGTVPFSADTPLGLLSAHVHKPVPRATAQNPRLGEAIADVLERVLAKQPDGRYPTAAAFATALEQASSQADHGTRETGAFGTTMATGLYLPEQPGHEQETTGSVPVGAPAGSVAVAQPARKRSPAVAGAALALVLVLAA